MPEPLERLGVHLPSLAAYLVNFTFLLVILYFVAYRPFLRRLNQRIEDARRIEQGVAETERLLDTARSDSQSTVKAARRQADLIIARATAEAKLEQQRAVEAGVTQARSAIRRERTKASEDVAANAADLVTLAAERVLSQSIDRETHGQLIRTAVQEATAELRRSGAALAPLTEVASAVKMTDAEWRMVGEVLAEFSRGEVHLVPHYDQRLLGGITVVSGDTVVDASLLGKLHRLRHELG